MRKPADGCRSLGRISTRGRILVSMKVLYLIADFFVATFGITEPTAKTRDQAAWFIAGLLVLLVAGVAAVGLLVLHVMTPK